MVDRLGNRSSVSSYKEDDGTACVRTSLGKRLDRVALYFFTRKAIRSCYLIFLH